MAEEKIVAARFPPLFRAVRTVLLEALRILRERLGDPATWPKAPFQEIEFTSSGSRTTTVEKYDLGEVLNRIWPEVAALESYKAASGELEALRKEGKAIAHFGFFSDLAAAYLGNFFRQYIRGLNADYAEPRFQDLYDRLEAYLASDFTKVKIILQLPQLKGELTGLELDQTHFIRKLDEDSARSVWSRGVMADVPARFRLSQLTGLEARFTVRPGDYVVEGIFEFPKSETGKMSLFLSSEERRSSWAFRLAYPGCGAIRFVAYDYVGFFPETGRILPGEEFPKGTFSYELTESVAEHIKRLWTDAFDVSRQLEADAKGVPTHIRIGMNRYLASFTEKVAEDRLMDYVVGLEALCGLEAEAVSYRIPLRVATLIGKDANEREKLFDIVAKGYAQRSKIAHGASAMTEHLDASGEKLLRQLQAILLRTIHTNLRAQKGGLPKKGDIIKLLESAIRTQERNTLESKISPEFL